MEQARGKEPRTSQVRCPLLLHVPRVLVPVRHRESVPAAPDSFLRAVCPVLLDHS